MATVTVCTGFGPAGYAQYGAPALESFDQFWPKDVRLVAYTEMDVPMPRGTTASLWDCNGATAFYDRHKDNPVSCGRAAPPGGRWSPKEYSKNYGWRWDALKWFRQCMIPEHASLALPDNDILVWLDGDVISYDAVPQDFVERLLGDADLIYLGRPNYGSEIGFYAMRLNPRVRQFLGSFAGAYRSDRVFTLREWHSAFVFDWVRREEESHGLRTRNMTPRGRGHVWFQSELGTCLDHLKGARKGELRSPERPRK